MKGLRPGPNKRMLTLLMILAMLILFWQLEPYYQDMRAKRDQIKQLEFFIASRSDPADSLGEEESRQVELEQQLLYLQGLTNIAIDMSSVGTKLIDDITFYAQQSGFALDSAFLLPAIPGDIYSTIGADVRGTGNTQALLTFAEYLANSNPVKIIESARISMLPSKLLQVELRVSTLFIENNTFSSRQVISAMARVEDYTYAFDQDFALFGVEKVSENKPRHELVDRTVSQNVEYVSTWQVKGIIYSLNIATAALYQENGKEQIVQVGDLLGAEKVISITSQQVVLEHNNAYATLMVKP